MHVKRFFRFSLRFLVLVTTLTACGLGIYLKSVKPLVRQRVAAQSFRQSTVRIRARRKTGLYATLLRLYLPDDDVCDVIELKAEHCGIADEDLASITDLPHVENLYLAGNPKVTDEGLLHLRALKHLKRVSLWKTSVTDDGLAVFSGTPKLEAIDISSPPTSTKPYAGFSRASLAHLRGLPNLRTLRFSFPVDENVMEDLATLPRFDADSLTLTHATDRQLEIAATWKNLRYLEFKNGTLEKTSIKRLANLPKLTTLRIHCRSVGDEELAAIGNLKSLRHLSLRGTMVSDAIGVELAKLLKLESVNLNRTAVTSKILESLIELPITALGLSTPFDDEAVEVLSRNPNLRTLIDIEQWEFYVSDRGLAALSQSSVSGGNVFDSRDGELHSHITNAGLSKFLSSKQMDGRWRFRGQLLTMDCLADQTATDTQRGLIIETKQPPSKLISRQLPQVRTAELGGYTSRFEMAKGPQFVSITSPKHDCDLGLLEYLPNIRKLILREQIHGSRLLGDWGCLRYVSQLDQFESDSPSWTLDGEAIRNLAAMAHLATVRAHVGSMSDAAFSDFADMKMLQSLVINCEPLTAAQMDSLCQIDTLEVLRLYGQQSVANSDALRSLQHLTMLKELWLYGIDDAAVPHICAATNLERLSVTGPGLTMVGLSELQDRLPKLKYLDARDSHASKRDLQRLQERKRPGVHIRTDR